MEEILNTEPKWITILMNWIKLNQAHSEDLNTSATKLQEVKMVKELPTFKGYTVDERLQEFRKVDKSKPSIDFVKFDSEKGQELLEEYEKTKE